MQRSLVALIVLAALGLGVLLGAAAFSEDASRPEAAEGARDVGGFEVDINEAHVAASAGVRAVLDRANIEATIDQLDAEISVPETIDIVVKDDPDEAYYSPEDREIVLSPAFVADTLASMREQYESKEDALDAAASNVQFVVLHEVGHALVDVLELPITGPEETAVDQFAVYALIELLDDPIAVLDASDLFDWVSYVPEEADFYDEHALDQQRFFELRCLLYGSDPDEFGEELEGLDIEEDRTEMCVDDTRRVFGSWRTLLERSSVD